VQPSDRPVRRVRRAGSRWRILVHEWRGTRYPGQPLYGHAYHVGSRKRDAEDGPYVTSTTLEGTEFDELVVGRWIHLEQMDTGKWWMNVGGVTINITADRDGRPRVIDVYGPGDWDEPAEGCRYALSWSMADGGGPARSDQAATGGE
jgi:hypothetical protein